MRGLLILAVGSILLQCVGCATARTANNVHVGSPKVYGGTRVNVAALSGNKKALETYKGYGIEAPPYPGVDFLPSLVFDTVLFPYALGYSMDEYIFLRR